MFCPTNEKLQNFTEKTKLLAQKCSQQIRVAAQQHLQNHYNSHQNQQQQQQKLNSEQEQCVSVEQEQQQQQEKYKSNSKIDNGDKNNENKNNKSSCNNSVKYLCSCTGGTLRSFSRKNKDGQSTVKWYVKQPTWRLWGEEREKDAIFTVYLKKVRYHRPTPSANNDSDDEISHLEWETVRVRFVKGATLARLVEALATDDGELESTFINVFLSTYRTFSNIKEILDLLIKRYDQLNELCLNEIELEHHNHHHNHHNNDNDNKFNNDDIDCSKIKSITATTTTTTVASGGTGTIYEQHKKTLVSALHVWLDGFPEDWNEDNLRYILNFTSKRLPHSELHIKVLQRLERFLRLPRLNDQQQQQHHHHHQQQQQQQQFNTPYYHFNNHHNHYENNQLHWTNSSPSLLSSYPPSINISSSVADITELFSGMCLTPAFRGPPSHLLQAYRFPHVPVKHFAEQLTRMDMELFKRLIPHQCLGATWAKRDKNEADTVVATVNQFNAVSYRVISSILVEPRIKPQERALNIATWIDIAQELRLLKNFSSLKAIISGLQSNAVYRLSKTWLALPREKLEIFNELARIFSEDNNAWTQREVLMREGTAKFADTVGENDRHLQKVFQKQDTHTSHGTIPYLGTFLTDLTMIHAAIPDTIGDGLINFDKKRKEFEILAQIKLLQGAANAYNLRSDHHFDRWFASMLVLDEREAHQISCQIEPQPELKTKSSSNNNSINSVLNSNNSNYNCSNNSCHKKSDSIASNSSSGAGSQFYYEINNLTTTTTTTTTLSNNTSRHSSRHNSLDRDTIPPTNSSSILSASSSISNLSIDSSNSGGQKSTLTTTTSIIQQQLPNIKCNGINNKNNGSISHINAQLVQSPQMKNTVPDFYIIRVTYETDNIETNGIVLYKSIMLGNNERTPQVIRNAMMKLGLDSDPDKWTLSQVLPDKELLMPPNANVYYAVNTAYNLNFILRHKKDDINTSKGQ